MENAPLVPRPAATVMLVREQGAGVEVFMVQRSAQSAFIPEAYVFPGGGLEEHDGDEVYAARIAGLDDDRMDRLFGSDAAGAALGWTVPLTAAQQRGLLVACVRELFEEAGVLLACPPLPPRHRLAQARAALQRGELTFSALIERADVTLDLSRLEAYSRWITPAGELRRFDTYFFLAPMPPQQHADADLVETTHGMWISPAEALARAARSELRIVYPTRLHLQRLACFQSLEALFAHARTKQILAVSPSPSPVDRKLHEFRLPDALLDRW